MAPSAPYDNTNIFARLLRGEIPCRKIYENPFALAFYDIQPQAPIHALVIPKGAYRNFSDFASNASEAEMVGFTKAVQETAAAIGATAGGFRLISNNGMAAHQEVPHYHVHILAGRPLGAMLAAGG